MLDKLYNPIADFINRNYFAPYEYVLKWVPRISRWIPPQGCDMWYSFPASIATALVFVEAQEQNRSDVTYLELNERFREKPCVTRFFCFCLFFRHFG